ncbi:hypothetical protein ACH5RR_012379 [Cinchona calisaya]|uniref:Uncharacterized protein n=1 Tax=Cinchona calisaya TaxID=153742 RepID=A0ABD3A950_9GENT
MEVEKTTKRLGDSKVWPPCVPLAIKFELFDPNKVKPINLPLDIGKLSDRRSISFEVDDKEREGSTPVTRREDEHANPHQSQIHCSQGAKWHENET